MQLEYYLLGIYSDKAISIKHAMKEINVHIEDNFLQEEEVISISKDHNVVVLVEVEQDDGYSETILVDNQGKVRKRLIFSLDLVDDVRRNIQENGLDETLTKTQLKRIESFCKEYDVDPSDFVSELLSEFLLDEYENNKQQLSTKLEKYFTIDKK